MNMPVTGAGTFFVASYVLNDQFETVRFLVYTHACKVLVSITYKEDLKTIWECQNGSKVICLKYVKA
jgi:hypothetical protein